MENQKVKKLSDGDLENIEKFKNHYKLGFSDDHLEVIYNLEKHLIYEHLQVT